MFDISKNRQLFELFNQINKSARLGKKRNLDSDFRQILDITNTKWSAHYQQSRIKDAPLIIASNHFARPFLQRKTFFTSLESFITSAIVTLAVSRITKRDVTWVVKKNLNNSLLYSNHARKTQSVSLACYDFIGCLENYPFGTKEAILKYLKKDFNVAIYPEGVTGQKLKTPNLGFDKLVNFIRDHKINFQILPVSIYFQNDIFEVVIGKAIETAKNQNTALQTMVAIAQSLPRQYCGDYKEYVNYSEIVKKAQGQQSPVGDQKPLLAQLRATLERNERK